MASDAQDVQAVTLLQHQLWRVLQADRTTTVWHAATALTLLLVEVWGQTGCDDEQLCVFIEKTAETAHRHAPPVAEC